MSGEKTALEIANNIQPLELEGAGEQIDLLEALGLPVNEKVIELRERTGKPGRPAGSRNKRTVEMAAFLLSQYKSPLEVLVQIAATPIAELAAALGCTKLEALQEIRLAAIASKPHLHSAMPLAVNVNERKLIYMNMSINAGNGADQGGTGLTREIFDLASAAATQQVQITEGKSDDDAG